MKSFVRVFCRASILLALLFLGTSIRATLLIDAFETFQSTPGGNDTRNVAVGPGILGGERDFGSYLTFSSHGVVPGQLLVACTNSPFGGRMGGDIVYDGIDGSASSGSYGGLGSVDLTQGATGNDRFRLAITSVTNLSADLTIECYSFGRGAKVSVPLPKTAGPFDVLFTQFQTIPSFAPIDFHNIGYISVSFAMSLGESMTLHSIVTTVPEPSVAMVGVAAATITWGRFSRLQLKSSARCR